MIGFYNYTVYLTYFSLIVSGVGLYQAANGRPLVAIFCLMVSGLCDMFDGKIARTRHKSTEMERNFGIQLDSARAFSMNSWRERTYLCPAPR